jgi:uncharacterized repeat protein (TIGR04002 family)
MAALIAVFTAFVQMPTGINSGYLHFGDSMIYLTGCIIAGPWGALASAIGGGLADVLAGAPQWAIPTAIIKAVNCLPFILVSSAYKKKHNKIKIINPLTIIMTIVSGAWTIGGYLIAEGIMYSFPTAITSVPFSIVQATGSAIIFIIAGLALDAVKIGKYLNK